MSVQPCGHVVSLVQISQREHRYGGRQAEAGRADHWWKRVRTHVVLLTRALVDGFSNTFYDLSRPSAKTNFKRLNYIQPKLIFKRLNWGCARIGVGVETGGYGMGVEPGE